MNESIVWALPVSCPSAFTNSSTYLFIMAIGRCGVEKEGRWDEGRRGKNNQERGKYIESKLFYRRKLSLSVPKSHSGDWESPFMASSSVRFLYIVNIAVSVFLTYKGKHTGSFPKTIASLSGSGGHCLKF